MRGFRQNDVPLDVLVIDMDWHLTFHQNWFTRQMDQSGHQLGWSGYTWNKLLFPDPDAFLKKIRSQGLKATLNLHPASGVQPWEDAYAEMAKRMGIDPATKKYVPFDITDKKFAANYELHRIATVDRNILRVAIYEMLYGEDVPPVVCINEAIEIAKKFGSEESGRFVNGILDRVKDETARPLR